MTEYSTMLRWLPCTLVVGLLSFCQVTTTIVRANDGGVAWANAVGRYLGVGYSHRGYQAGTAGRTAIVQRNHSASTYPSTHRLSPYLPPAYVEMQPTRVAIPETTPLTQQPTLAPLIEPFETVPSQPSAPIQAEAPQFRPAPDSAKSSRIVDRSPSDLEQGSKPGEVGTENGEAAAGDDLLDSQLLPDDSLLDDSLLNNDAIILQPSVRVRLRSPVTANTLNRYTPFR